VHISAFVSGADPKEFVEAGDLEDLQHLSINIERREPH